MSPRLSRASVAAVLLATRAAAAQAPEPAPPTPTPTPAGPATPAPPLAQIKDDKQLADALQAITQDPAIAVDDPATRPLAQALMTEGVRQLQARAHDQALANFLEAYAKFPSPKILLNIASTLRDMGRLADAANTYQRYLTDPATGAERIAEVKELLLKLDEQLTILTVRVVPHGSDISIDGGPFITVGSSLVTRVRSGLHLVRIRRADQVNELTVNGFDGENKEVTPSLAAMVAAEPTQAPTQPPPQPTASPVGPVVIDTRPPELKSGAQKTVPEHVEAWLVTGTQYGVTDATSRERTVHDRSDGHAVAPIVPHYDVSDRGEAAPADPDDESIDSGVLGVMRIDGKGRGFAGGAGLAISRGKLEIEIMLLKSDEVGGYLGLRYRLLTGFFRPYGAVGAPGFVFDHDELSTGGATVTTRRLAVGARVAAGIELMINGHLSVQGDLGYEHFFFVDDHYEADVFVPTLGVIGRL
jgi:hypothetical protein